MSLAEELLADLEEDGFDESEPMIVQEEEPSHDLQENVMVQKQTGSKLILGFILAWCHLII